MEYIKIAKVDDVLLHRKGIVIKGSLHLTTHHLIFTSEYLSREFWVSYPTIGSLFKNHGSALLTKVDKIDSTNATGSYGEFYSGQDLWSFTNIKIIGKDYTVFSIDFFDDIEARDVYDSLLKLTVLNEVSQLYAFIYTPNNAETNFDSWKIYDIVKEFRRQGLDLEDKNCAWRLTNINDNYRFSATYPSKLVVPTQVSDTLLTHAAKYRSQGRIPTLTYYYKRTNCTITRSAQPLSGLTKQRSVQDEKLVLESFQASQLTTKNSTTLQKNIIVDARPTTNAMAQAALGGGTESMENYNFNKTCSRIFLGIDNIHVMSETLNYVVDNFLVDGDLNLAIDKELLNSGKSSNWLKYIRLLLSSTDKLAKSIIFNNSNVLVHCSDGWDRTAQVCSLVQICLDPYYRTMEGFMVLIEKDWLAFGHRFQERSGILSSESIFHDNTVGFGGVSKPSSQTGNNDLNSSTTLFGKDGNELSEIDSIINISASSVLNTDIVNKVSEHFKKKKKNRKMMKFTSPIFQQFLDCVYQLFLQNSDLFEFNERFLRRLVYHLYSCQYGTFLYNNERERVEGAAYTKTRSVWDYFRSRKTEFTNKEYAPTEKNGHKNFPNEEEDWILPDLQKVQWWSQLYGRKDKEMNGVAKIEKAAHVGLSNTSDSASIRESAKNAGIKFPSFGFFGKR